MLESIIRPFADDDSSPQPFEVPGQSGAAIIQKLIGYPGGTKIFTVTTSSTTSFYMGQVHKEKAPTSQSLQDKLSSLAS